ncbi:MAG: hypothetical protein C0436_04465 [Alphaproteobacteria bacterium]|nr:hypothetical protein [Alphaproteobacteria bacterium]
MQHSMTPEEQRFYRLDSFPQTNSERREFIFARTGFSAKPLDHRGWYLFNKSMNNGLDLGLDERTLQILSLMDHALADVRRFVGVANMHEIASDSTAAHTKQAMNIVQHVIEDASQGAMSKEMDSFRRKALLGTWVHDMGEIVTELTTASDMFGIAPERQKALSHAKNELEEKIFIFGCELAGMAIDKANPSLFYDAIERLRSASREATTLEGRIENITAQLEVEQKRADLPNTLSTTTHRLLEWYESVESKAEGNMLHPFVKTLEAVEGQRYLQRNSNITKHTRLELSTSHEVISAARRAERRLPELFEQASHSPMNKKLAIAAAKFTYRSIARQCLPSKDDMVSLIPPFIVRDAGPDTEPHSSTLVHNALWPVVESKILAAYHHMAAVLDARVPNHGLSCIAEEAQKSYVAEAKEQSLEAVRTRFHAELAERWQKQRDGNNGRIMSREQLGLLYRAAERAVASRHGFVPDTASLMNVEDTPRIPKLLEQVMRDIEKEMHANDKVHSLRSEHGKS